MTARLTALIAAGLFAGAAVYVTLVEHPARLALSPEIAVLEFRPSYARATVMQATLAIVGSAAGLAAWRATRRSGWLLGAVFLGSIVLFTLVVIFPTNHRLLDQSAQLPPDEARDLLVHWGNLHAVRSILGLAAFVAFALSM